MRPCECCYRAPPASARLPTLPMGWASTISPNSTAISAPVSASRPAKPGGFPKHLRFPPRHFTPRRDGTATERHHTAVKTGSVHDGRAAIALGNRPLPNPWHWHRLRRGFLMRRHQILPDLKNGVSALALMALAFGGGAASAGALPGHGHFVRGAGTIAKSRGAMTVDQSTQTGIVNWKTFSLGKANSIVFDNNGGATLNIVRGNSLSRISGSLQSNGSVYLVNRA